MQTIAADLASVRQMEAISFRSLPATYSYFNGAWAVRLTENHPAKRLNSVTPLDPGDHSDIENRVDLEMNRFLQVDRPLTIRVTPLAPPQLISHLDELNWQSLDNTSVMTMDLENADLSPRDGPELIENIEEWVSEYTGMQDRYQDYQTGLVEVLQKIQAPLGLFLTRDENFKATAATRLVLNNKLVGIFDLVTRLDAQRQGLARSIMNSALFWARENGARQAWLQVVKDNEAAMALYHALGFSEFYSYVYRRPPQVNN